MERLSDENLELCEIECISIGGDRGDRVRAALSELQAHRAMVKRLEAWAERLEAESRLEYLDMSVRGRVAGIAAELRNRMRGA